MKKGNKRLIVIYAVLLIILTICYVWVDSITHLDEPEIPQYDAVYREPLAVYDFYLAEEYNLRVGHRLPEPHVLSIKRSDTIEYYNSWDIYPSYLRKREYQDKIHQYDAVWRGTVAESTTVHYWPIPLAMFNIGGKDRLMFPTYKAATTFDVLAIMDTATRPFIIKLTGRWYNFTDDTIYYSSNGLQQISTPDSGNLHIIGGLFWDTTVHNWLQDTIYTYY